MTDLRRASQAAVILAMLGLASPAGAVQYDTDIDIDTETDLYDLAARGEIEVADLETLVDLFRNGVDLNLATREEIYELPGLTYEDVDEIIKYRELTRIHDPADLVTAGALTQEQLLQIAPFLIVGEANSLGISGHVRAMSAASTEDRQAPPAFLQASAKFPYSLSAGLALVTTRQMIGGVSYSLDQGGLVASEANYQVHLPKYYAQWKTPHWQVIAGTYRVGFGERLTLDNTSRNAPAGLYADEVMYIASGDLTRECALSGGTNVDGTPCGTSPDGTRYVTPDFYWRDAFRGVGAHGRLPVGASSELAFTAFGSYQSRSIYQYEIYSRDTCDDPHGTNDACKAPPVYVAGANGIKFAYQTLPDLYNEAVAGANATFTFSSGTHLGVTGYWANDYFNGMNLDFQEWSSRPYGGAFGAVGVDGQARAGRFNLFLEGTRSFDRMPGGGGGFGVLQRTVANIQKAHEVELSLRYYAKDFVNPMGRPIASFDEFEGQRARNEAGLRLRYHGKPNEDWALRLYADVSAMPRDGAAADTAGTTNLDLLGRLDFNGWRKVRISGWVQYKNKDLAVGGRGQCFSVASEYDAEGNSLPCQGEFVRFAARVHVEPLGKKLAVSAQYQHTLLDDAKYKTRFRQDSMGWVDLTSFPVDQFRIRWRTRYLNEAIDDNTYMEQSLWSYLDLGWLPNRNWELHLRYDLYGFLDQRTSTLSRASPIQHRFRLELEARF